MVVFPNCKINLGLQVLDKRPDGFHNLETVFYPVPFKDALEVIPAKDKDQPEDIVFTQSGITIDGETGNNICIKAFRLLKQDFLQLPLIRMHLHKAIPTGAGLGGGSADGAFTLKLLNDQFRLGLSNDQLIHYAALLGSDCPFFTVNRPCYATGRGEILEPISLSLAGYRLLLINPGIHIHTGLAFSRLKANVPAKDQPSVTIREIIQQPLHSWRDSLKNDFEPVLFDMHPELSKLKDDLYALGAIYVAMSGSGSTIYGIFDSQAVPRIDLPAHYLVKNFLL